MGCHRWNIGGVIGDSPFRQRNFLTFPNRGWGVDRVTEPGAVQRQSSREPEPGLGNRTLWKCAIALFNVRKKCEFKICTFFTHFCQFSIFERAIVRSQILSNIWKVRKKVRSHNHTFSKNDKKCDRKLALFQRVTKKCDCTFAFFQRATKKCDPTFAQFAL